MVKNLNPTRNRRNRGDIMLEKGKIRAGQLMWLLITIGTALLVPMSQIAVAAGSRQDSWLAEILSLAIQLVMLRVVLKLAMRFPGMEFASCLKEICGSFLGNFIALLYIWFFIFSSAAFLREITSFSIAMIYIETPPFVISLIILFTAGYIAFLGLEVIARTNEIILPIIIILYFTAFFLLLKEINWDNLKPVLENGVIPILRGAFVSSGSFVFVAFVAVALPYINKPRECRRSLALGSIIQGVAVIFATIVVIGVMGPGLAQSTLYRGYLAVRYISYANFVEHLDPIALSIFVLSRVIKISVFFYASCLVTGQLFNLKSYRFLYIPAGIVILIFSRVFFRDAAQLNRFFVTIWPIHNYIFELVFPLFLLILAMVRKKGEQET